MLDKYLKLFFVHYAKILVGYWPFFMVTPIILTGILGMGLLNSGRLFKHDSVELFTPYDARSLREKALIKNTWPLKDADKFIGERDFSNVENYFFIIIISRPDGKKNLLDPLIFKEAEELERKISSNLTVTDEHGKSYGFQDLCLGWHKKCYHPAKDIINLLKSRYELAEINIKVTFPTANKEGNSVFLGTSLSNVTVHEDTKIIKSVSAFKFAYFLRSDSEKYDKLAMKFEAALDAFMASYRAIPADETPIMVNGFHRRTFDKGMQESSELLMPKVTITFIVLWLFATLSTTILKQFPTSPTTCWNAIDWVRSKPAWAGAGILTAAMGMLTGMGLPSLLLLPTNSISSVVPFLVTSIGVDDMFILTAAWHESYGLVQNSRRREVDVKSIVLQRMQHTLSEAAVSITITSLTDALSFAIGGLTKIPAVSIFCRDAALSIVFNYIYQITFFAAIMVIGGIAEERRQNSIFFCCISHGENKGESTKIDNGGKKIKKKLYQIKPTTTKNPNKVIIQNDHVNPAKNDNNTNNIFIVKNGHSKMDLVPSVAYDQNQSIMANGQRKRNGDPNGPPLPAIISDHRPSFFAKWALFLQRTEIKLITLAVYIVYVCLSIWGITVMEEGLEYGSLVLKTNPVLEYLRWDRERFIYGMQITIVVSNPPDFSNVNERDKFMRVVEELESSPYVESEFATNLFLRAYMKYMRQTQSYPSEDTDKFLMSVYQWTQRFAFRQQWSRDIAWDFRDKINRTGFYMKAFRFYVTVTDFRKTTRQRETVRALRVIVDNHPDYQMDTYGMLWELTDQFDIIIPNTLQNIAIALACMIVVSFLLIPKVICTLWITMAIVSIDIGVVGFISWWGVNMDSISMITIIMSIGFSVDFTAHVTYGYVSSKSKTAADKTIDALERLGWPVFQGAFSTVAGIMVLYFVDSYLISVFFKTIFLVIILGMIHALIFLPILMATFMPFLDRLYNNNNNNN